MHFLTISSNHNFLSALYLAMPEILKSSKAAIEKRLLQKSPFEKLCSDIIPALVEALVKVIL